MTAKTQSYSDFQTRWTRLRNGQARTPAANSEVLKHLNNLPELKEGEDENLPAGKAGNLKTIEKIYKELSDPKHPVSVAMFKMDTIEEIAIIEGKK